MFGVVLSLAVYLVYMLNLHVKLTLACLATTPILWLTLFFAIAIILISQWKGVRAMLSMAFSLYVIIGYIIPRILVGDLPAHAADAHESHWLAVH